MDVGNFIRLAARSFAYRLRSVNSVTIDDYNAAAATYDEYYSRCLGKAGSTLIERFTVNEGDKIIDLASGTGYFTQRFAAAVGRHGRVIAIDLSPGMLAKNRDKAIANGFHNIDFYESDALAWLKEQPSGEVDGLVCGWGICYMNHSQLRSEIERVLRPGGCFGIIENRARSLQAVSDLFRDALVAHPQALAKNMQIALPSDERYLVKTFCKGLLEHVDAWRGEVIVPCASGEGAADYMLKSGASAGFIDALDKEHFDTMWAEFVKKADAKIARDGEIPVKHEYCGLVGKKKTI
jgi:ubiquinone/menaquinone biosynthesis C-methylase UbiE